MVLDNLVPPLLTLSTNQLQLITAVSAVKWSIYRSGPATVRLPNRPQSGSQGNANFDTVMNTVVCTCACTKGIALISTYWWV